jgi:glycosyltransferase involved in cell wall biosynthesis
MNESTAGAGRLPTVSVVIAAFASDRWNYLQDAVKSVQAQTVPVLETVVVIDHNPELLALARHEFDGVTVIANAGTPGASGSRNTGVAVCHGEIVAFLDDDARAEENWLEVLLPHFVDDGIVGVGGRVDPLWASSRPRWFPPEFNWTIGASYPGMPDKASKVRNVWSNNMAIRRSAFKAINGFRDNFGKVGQRSRPEDTDLCLRSAAESNRTWMYEPDGAAGHWVPAQRTTLGYFVRRCFNEGMGKAALASMNGASQSTSAERDYARRVLPRAITRGLREVAGGDLSGGLRSAAIAVGFCVAAVGFVAGRTQLAWSA